MPSKSNGSGSVHSRRMTAHASARLPTAGFDALHAYFLDRLVPVCAQLLDAAAEAGEISSDMDALALMHGIGNLCIGADSDPRYDARRMVELLIAGLLHSRPT